MTTADIVVIAASLFGGFVSGLTGFALGLIVLGIWLHVMPPSVAGPVLTICVLWSQALALPSLRRHIDARRLWPFLVGGLPGVPIGVWLLRYVDPVLFKRAVGVFLMASAAYLLFGKRAVVTGGGRKADGAIGFVGGILGGLAGLSGAVPTLWSVLRGCDKDASRAVYQTFNLVILSTAVVGLWIAGSLHEAHLHFTLVALPCVAIGVFAGLQAYRWVDRDRFRRLVLVLLLASGAALML